MVLSSPAKYAARLTELEALHHELETGKRPGDGAVVVGLLLEAAGDVLRRRAALKLDHAAAAANVTKPVDNSDNANSVVTLLSYGDFDFLNTGDLTWNREFDLVCPVNRVGTVDVFQVSHHGLDVSNNPVLVKSVSPRVAIVNNGVTKGNMPVMFATLQETPSIEAVYQLHKTDRPEGSSKNVPDEYIANHSADCQAAFVKLSVAADGKSYTVNVPSTKHLRKFASK